AIVTDAVSFFRPRLQASLDAIGGLTGLNGPSGGPWKFAAPDLSLEIFLEQNPWRLGLRTSGSGGLSLGGGASLLFDANVALPAFAPSLDATLKIGALNLSYAQATQTLSLGAPPCLPPITLLPKPSASELGAKLNELLPRVLFSSSAGALL